VPLARYTVRATYALGEPARIDLQRVCFFCPWTWLPSARELPAAGEALKAACCAAQPGEEGRGHAGRVWEGRER